jgi:hypothetical protein
LPRLPKSCTPSGAWVVLNREKHKTSMELLLFRALLLAAFNSDKLFGSGLLF